MDQSLAGASGLPSPGADSMCAPKEPGGVGEPKILVTVPAQNVPALELQYGYIVGAGGGAEQLAGSVGFDHGPQVHDVGPPAAGQASSVQVRVWTQPPGFAGHAGVCVVAGLDVWTQGGGGVTQSL